MKHVITLISPDGKEFVLDSLTKITIKNFVVSDDAVYGKTYNHAFIKEAKEDDNTITIKFVADYVENELKAIKPRK